MKTINLELDDSTYSELVAHASTTKQDLNDLIIRSAKAWVSASEGFVAQVKRHSRRGWERGQPNKVSSIEDYLLSRLSGGPVPSSVIFDECRDEWSASRPCVRRAQKKVGIIAVRVGGPDGYWAWALPDELSQRSVKMRISPQIERPATNLKHPGSTRASSKSEKSIDEINSMIEESREAGESREERKTVYI